MGANYASKLAYIKVKNGSKQVVYRLKIEILKILMKFDGNLRLE
jgi:hypothetical protein